VHSYKLQSTEGLALQNWESLIKKKFSRKNKNVSQRERERERESVCFFIPFRIAAKVRLLQFPPPISHFPRANNRNALFNFVDDLFEGEKVVVIHVEVNK